MPVDTQAAVTWCERWESVMSGHVRDRAGWIRRVVDTSGGLLDGDPRLVLDLACGTGALTRACAAAWPRARVVGVDADPVALRLAGLASPVSVETVHADMTPSGWAGEAGLPARGADLVVSGWAWHEVGPDSAGGVAAGVARLLRPGGVLVVADFLPLSDRSPRLAGFVWSRIEAIWAAAADVPGAEPFAQWWEELRAAAADDPELRAAFTVRDAWNAHRRHHHDEDAGDPPTDPNARERVTVDVGTWRTALLAAGFVECETLARDDDTALLAAVLEG